MMKNHFFSKNKKIEKIAKIRKKGGGNQDIKKTLFSKIAKIAYFSKIEKIEILFFGNLIPKTPKVLPIKLVLISLQDLAIKNAKIEF